MRLQAGQELLHCHEIFRSLVRLPEEQAWHICVSYFYAGGRNPQALAELVERARASDPFLGVYLARWGPSVLEDQATLDALLAAYAYLGTPIPNLPEKKSWKLQELVRGTSSWLTGSVTYSAGIYVGSEGRRFQEIRLRFPWLEPKAVEALQALEDIQPVTSSDITRALIRLHLGFDYAWDETLSRLNSLGITPAFSSELKRIYLDPFSTLMGKDFYEWVIELVYSGFIVYASERNLLYTLVAYRHRIVREARRGQRPSA